MKMSISLMKVVLEKGLFIYSMDVSFVLFSCSCFLCLNSVLTPVKTSQSFPKSNQAQDHPHKTLHRIHLDGILQATLLVHYHLLNLRAEIQQWQVHLLKLVYFGPQKSSVFSNGMSLMRHSWGTQPKTASEFSLICELFLRLSSWSRSLCCTYGHAFRKIWMRISFRIWLLNLKMLYKSPLNLNSSYESATCMYFQAQLCTCFIKIQPLNPKTLFKFQDT